MTELTDILNWRRRDDRTTLSGQPTEVQFEAIRDLGVGRVINLGPYDNEGALADEPGTLAALGIEYTYIPVDFENPTQDDFDAFCAALDDAGPSAVHVHCIYNARVTAFFYRYAKEGRGGDITEAADMMDSIWRPGGVWATFIGKPEDAGKPNRYLGYEY